MVTAHRAVWALAIVSAAAPLAMGTISFDGTIDFSSGAEWTAQIRAIQDNYTQFGNQILGGFSGSELDELYARTDGYFLYVGATGNLEESGNSVAILLDVRAGGQNVLATEIAPVPWEMPCSGNGPPYAVQNMGQALTNDGGTPAQTIRDASSTGTVLDATFEPDYIIAVDTFGGNVHVTQYDLSATALGTWDDPGTNDGSGGACTPPNEVLPYYAQRAYRGEVGVDSGIGILSGGVNPNGSECAYNNSGYAGVTGAAVAVPGSGLPGDPRTQTTGLEAKIALADLGLPTPLSGDLNIKIAVVLTSGGGLFSNQTLPGIAGAIPPANIGMRPSFAGIPGNQFASVTRAPTAPIPAIDGLNIPAEFGLADLVASQDTPTSFGDHPQNPNLNTAGSEIDQLIIKPGTLDIAITGNLELNGNNLIIFLDTLPGVGEGLTTPLDGNAGRISGLARDIIPLDADYAVVINNASWGTTYVDLIDLVNNTTTYIGENGVNSGEGILDFGGPVADWRVALANNNVVGVDDNALNDPYVQQANAETATTGFEIRIPLAAVGSPADGTSACIFAMVTGGGYMSNQLLPAGIGGGLPNFGNAPVDLTAYGYSCLSTGPLINPPCNTPPQDADTDGDVDLSDFSAFSACFNGPNKPWPGLPVDQRACRCMDQDTDGDVDLTDFGAFSACFNGPNNPPSCP